MFENLSPQEKKALKIGAIGLGVVVLAYGIKSALDARSGLPGDDPTITGGQNPGLPAPGGEGAGSNMQVDKATAWNVNAPLCYKSPYTRMVKVLQSGINTIAKKVNEPTIKVDGDFGPATLKKVHSYFNAECVNLSRMNDRIQSLRSDVTDGYGGSGGSW